MSSLVGVLALQGDVREHLAALDRLNVAGLPVRRRSELQRCDGLIIPGGESTTIEKLARAFDLFDPIRDRIADGQPTLGTCAGMVLLADRVTGGIAGQSGFGGIDMTVRRNAFGRQIQSFEGEIEFADFSDPFHAVFIRAPWVESVGEGVSVLARTWSGTESGEIAGKIVAVRQDRVMATAFHPEMGKQADHDDRVHQYFVESVLQS